MTREVDRSWVVRSDVAIEPDPARVVARIFLPGQEIGTLGRSRATAVLERVLALSDAEVDAELGSVVDGFAHRHRDLVALWSHHAELVGHRLDDPEALSDDRRRLAGAYFTQEFAIEGAALFNPSAVAHPDQSGLEPGSTRFLLSLRAVGEGHVSSIELRTGVIDERDVVRLDDPSPLCELPAEAPSEWTRSAFSHQLGDMWGDHVDSDFVLSLVPDPFGRTDLDAALATLREQQLTRDVLDRTAERFEWIAASSYSVEFDEACDLSSRALMPRGPAESHGMEDVRLVRLDDAFVGTYTAYDGERVSSQLLTTTDFRRFTIRRMSGPGSLNKGMALFPRRVGGRYLALSRSDRESNGITASDDLQHWSEAEVVQTPEQPWELVQLGNCGSPIETEAGWLVLTHGVGAMRRYSIGAILLDLDDPTVVVGRLTEPLLVPTEDERSGYVPNVVYSCGAMLHGRTLLLPYGCSDRSTRVATVALDPLLAELLA